MSTMTIYQATMLAEGSPDLAGVPAEEVNDDLMAEAWQVLIDTGACWRLQGWFGRTAVHLIEAGVVQPNRNAIH